MAPASSTPVGPPPTMTKVRCAARSAVIRLGLGGLEGAQQTRADEGRLLHVLHARCKRAPVIVAEIVVDRPRGEDEVVVGHGGRAGDAGCAAPDRRRSTSPSMTRALRWERSMVRIGWAMSAGRERRRGHLVEQRLEQVIVVVVDDQHIGRRAPQRLGGKQPAEATANDYDPRPTGAAQAAPPPPNLRIRSGDDYQLFQRRTIGATDKIVHPRLAQRRWPRRAGSWPAPGTTPATGHPAGR